MKTDDGDWNIAAHKDRINEITKNELRIFCEVFDGGEVPIDQSRLPVIFSSKLLSVLKKIATYAYICIN